jgi:hypothetical protein
MALNPVPFVHVGKLIRGILFPRIQNFYIIGWTWTKVTGFRAMRVAEEQIWRGHSAREHSNKSASGEWFLNIKTGLRLLEFVLLYVVQKDMMFIDQG